MAVRELLAKRGLLLGSLLCILLFAGVWYWPSLSATWHMSRAKRYLDARENERALEKLQVALRADPDRGEIHFLLAKAQRRLGDLDQVPVLLRRAVELGGDAERAQREEWLLLAQMGRLRDAEPHLKELLIEPSVDGTDVCEAYALGYFANLRVDDALRLLDIWQDQCPEDAQPYFMRAYAFDAISLLPEAVEAYREGLRIKPNDTTMMRRCAQVLIKLREYDEAESLLGRCMEESPEDPEAATIWADCLFEQDKVEEAHRVVSTLLSDGVNSFEVRILAGLIHLAEGQLEDALPHLQAAVEQRPFDRNARYGLATALKGLGRTAEAQPHLDYVAAAKEPLDRLEAQMYQAIEQPDDADLRFEIATTLLNFGSPVDSARWLRSVLELQPKHAEAAALYRRLCSDPQGAAQYSESVPVPAEPGASEE